MCVLSIKVPIRKKSGNLFDDPCISFSGQISIKTKSTDWLILIACQSIWGYLCLKFRELSKVYIYIFFVQFLKNFLYMLWYQEFLSNTNNFQADNIWPIYGILKGTTTLNQSGAGSKGNKGALTFSRSWELKPHHQKQFSAIPLIPLLESVWNTTYSKTCWLDKVKEIRY